MNDTKPTGLSLLRVPFKSSEISKLPKPTKAQTEAVVKDFRSGIRCPICGGWHHKDVIHIDYVGHAALTSRLLDADPEWTWTPLAFDENGLPRLDNDGGMWISLTVCGHTRLGYGDAQGKKGGDAMKERIGDALRNAAMRFGAALDLWHKGDLVQGTKEPEEDTKEEDQPKSIAPWTKKALASVVMGMKTAKEVEDFIALNSAQIAIDLPESDNKAFRKWVGETVNKLSNEDVPL